MNAPTCPKCGGVLPANAPSGVCPKCLLMAGFAAEDGSQEDHSGQVFAVTTPQPPGAGGFNPPAPVAIAALFPQLEILQVLGHGGMGAVYKARQSKLDRIVALKIIRPETADDPAFAERFNREARTLARLNHPHIVAVHDFGEVQLADSATGGQPRPLYYFVMEYVDGANLRQLMEAGTVKPDQALAIIPQICEALQFAHDEGIVHRDIKPENVLIDSRGRVKIADFGLAKLAARTAGDFTLTGTHQVMGTPRYMAPEQMTGSHHVDHRADIYSLGVVFYELLTGEVPLGQFDPPSKRAPVDARLDGIVLRALAREPDRRFQRASEMKSSVEVISSASLAQPAVMPQPLPPRGASTIIEREVAAAWRWVAGQPGDAANQPAQFPTLLALLLAVAGTLMFLLPWMDITIPDPGSAGAASVALADHRQESTPARTQLASFITPSSDDEPVLEWALDRQVMLLETAIPIAAQEQVAWPSDYASSFGLPKTIRIQPGETFTLHGYKVLPGLIAAANFAWIVLIVWILPSRLWSRWTWNLLIVIFAAAALACTILFPMEVENIIVSFPAPADVPATQAPVQTPTASSPDREGAQVRLVQDVYPGSPIDGELAVGDQRLIAVNHFISYREGFYGSLALSFALLLLGATGVRRGIATPPAAGDELRAPGAPVARVRFSAPAQSHLGTHVVAHFESHGYRLKQQGIDRWVFQRGSKAAGLYATDIRAYDTLLTVRSSPAQPGRVWVTCLWEVRKLGAVILQNDIATLEGEGRELESVLNESAPNLPAEQTLADASSIREGGGVAAEFALQHTPTPHPANTLQPVVFDSKSGERVDLEEAFAEVDPPSLAMIVAGILMMIGHSIFLMILLNNPFDDEMAWMMLPGIITGLGMVCGGASFRGLRSPGVTTLGIIAAFIPSSPGCVIVLPIGIWNLVVYRRSHIARAFRQWRRQRAAGAFTIPATSQENVDLDEVWSEVDGPSLSMMVTGLLMLIGHLIWLVVLTNEPGDEEVAWITVPGALCGLGLLVGGLNLRWLWSRGWAQLGIIAGYIPASPGWLLGIGISVWAQRVLKRPQVFQAFLQRRRQQFGRAGERIPPSTGSIDLDAVRSEVDGPSLAMIVMGLLIAIGHVACAIFFFNEPGAEEYAGIGVLGIVTGLGMFIGGINLRTLKSRGWAQLGIISGMIPSGPGFVLALPISLWSLAVFNRPHIPQAFLQRQRERMSGTGLATSPRYSRKAIVGAFWAGLFLLIIPALAFTEGVMWGAEAMTFDASGQPIDPQPSDFGRGGGVALIFVLPILLAPIGTTMLGYMAVGDITRSQGRIAGLGLAVFDAVVFPLLLANGALFMAFMFFYHFALRMDLMMSIFLSLAGAAAIGMSCSFAVVRRWWRSLTASTASVPHSNS